MSLVRTYFPIIWDQIWDQIEVGDIIYAKGNNTPLTIKTKVNEGGIMGFTIDLEVKPSPPFSWVSIENVDKKKVLLSSKDVRGGARRHKNRKSTKKARRNHRYYFRRSRRN